MAVYKVAKLEDLILLRNDPAVAAEFLQAARAGDVDAQYGMGLIYAEGRGVAPNEAQAFFWLTLAHEQGDGDAEVLRRSVAYSMTDEQFDRARALLQAHAGHPRGQARGRKHAPAVLH